MYGVYSSTQIKPSLIVNLHTIYTLTHADSLNLLVHILLPFTDRVVAKIICIFVMLHATICIFHQTYEIISCLAQKKVNIFRCGSCFNF